MVPPRPRPGWPSASESRCRRHARSPSSQRRPRSCPTWWGPCARATSPLTRCAPSSTWRPAATDRELSDQAKERSVRELVEVARDAAAAGQVCFCIPFTFRTRQPLPALQRRAPHHVAPAAHRGVRRGPRPVSTRGLALSPLTRQAPLDQRRGDGFMGIVDSATPGAGVQGRRRPAGPPSDPATAPNPFFVVAHVPLEALVEESGETSELAGELEHHGLIDVETVQRIACDATVVVAVDDHGRATPCTRAGRGASLPAPSDERSSAGTATAGIRAVATSLLPSSTTSSPWKPGGGTDLPNLVLLCRHHHGVVHRKGWSLSGDANEELSIVGPTRPGHGLAPFAPLDEGDGTAVGGSSRVGVEPIARAATRADPYATLMGEPGAKPEADDASPSARCRLSPTTCATPAGAGGTGASAARSPRTTRPQPRRRRPRSLPAGWAPGVAPPRGWEGRLRRDA